MIKVNCRVRVALDVVLFSAVVCYFCYAEVDHLCLVCVLFTVAQPTGVHGARAPTEMMLKSDP